MSAVRPADLVVLGARIATGDAQFTEASAMAITADRITFVGDEAGARARVDAATVVLELDGERIIPGLIDSHFHLVRAGMSWVDEMHWAHHRSLAAALEKAPGTGLVY
jgi:predicted amidohydrolase YtcJ